MNTPIIYTLDYEIFGDGSGNPLVYQIANTRRLCDSLAVIGAKMTIFVEYGQLAFFEKYRDIGEYDIFYKTISAQLVELCKQGHDIQLHFHPSWEGAELSGSGAPVLKIDQDDITSLDFDVALGWLKRGKIYLENLLVPINKDYKCLAFRAGAFTACDQKKYVQLLEQASLKIDSSVLPGGALKSYYGNYDYSSIKKISPYRIKDSLVLPNEGGSIVEYPILTEVGRLAPSRYFNSHGRKNRKIMSVNYKQKITDTGQNKWAALVKKLARGYAIADFNFVGARQLIKIIESRIDNSALQPSPLTLIGHSKFSYFCDEVILLDLLMNELDCRFEYTTLTEHHFRSQ